MNELKDAGCVFNRNRAVVVNFQCSGLIEVYFFTKVKSNQ